MSECQWNLATLLNFHRPSLAYEISNNFLTSANEHTVDEIWKCRSQYNICALLRTRSCYRKSRPFKLYIWIRNLLCILEHQVDKERMASLTDLFRFFGSCLSIDICISKIWILQGRVYLLDCLTILESWPLRITGVSLIQVTLNYVNWFIKP